jgi:hypothetical protein
MDQGTAVGWAAQESATPQGAERDLMLQSGSGHPAGADEGDERKPAS